MAGINIRIASGDVLVTDNGVFEVATVMSPSGSSGLVYKLDPLTGAGGLERYTQSELDELLAGCERVSVYRG